MEFFSFILPKLSVVIFSLVLLKDSHTVFHHPESNIVDSINPRGSVGISPGVYKEMFFFLKIINMENAERNLLNSP